MGWAYHGRDPDGLADDPAGRSVDWQSAGVTEWFRFDDGHFRPLELETTNWVSNWFSITSNGQTARVYRLYAKTG